MGDFDPPTHSKSRKILLLLCCFIASLTSLVSGDFSIIDVSTGEIVFKTSSDFVRDGCATFVENAYLSSASDLNGCNPLPVPPSPSLWMWWATHKWVLLIQDDAKCHFDVMRRNAARAGYSGVIVGTGLKYLKTKKRNKTDNHYMGNNGQTLVDMHLVHPLDVKIVAKNYSFPKEFMVESPPVYKCPHRHVKSLSERLLEYAPTLPTIRLEDIIDYIIYVVSSTVHACGQLLKAAINFCRSLLTADFIVFLSELILIITTTLAFVGFFLAFLTFCASPLYFFRNPSSFIPTFKSMLPIFFAKQSDNDADYADEGKKEKRRRPVRVMFSSDRKNLGMDPNEMLTRNAVNQAYRKKALKYHPDKNQHRSKEVVAKLEEKFRAITKSKDTLLAHIVKLEQNKVNITEDIFEE